MTVKFAKYVFIVPILLITTSMQAQERLDMQGTSIIGNKELPNVLYIVPWKPAGTVDLETPPFKSVLDDVLKPVDRSSFKQQVKYYYELYPSTK